MGQIIAAVTGANGHVGNNLCRELLRKGVKVRALINHNDSALKGLDVSKVIGSVTNTESLVELIEGADYIFHLAAVISIGDVSKKKLFDVNVKGTKNVINVCKQFQVKRLIHFSSIHALDSNGIEQIDECTPLAGHNVSLYDQSKAAAEREVLKAGREGLSTIILNPTAIVGPNDFIPSLVGEMIIKMAKGKLPFIIKGGYNWVDVRDVVLAAVNAMSKGRSSERYILSGEWESLKIFTGIIASMANHRKPLIVPLFLAKIGLPFVSVYSFFTGHKALYTNEALKIVSKEGENIISSKAKKELDFKNRPISETFIDTYNWFVANKFIT